MVTNLKDLMNKFNDEAKCRAFLVQQRWNGSPVCPYCKGEKWYSIENGKRFKCGNNKCYKKYSVTVGTVFEGSNIPLTTWFPAMYIISAHKKGISSVQLAKDLGVTQKTAWFMLHRIRESLKDKNSTLLSGTVEIDETYMAKKFRSKYVGLSPDEVDKLNQDQELQKKNNKGAVIGLVQRAEYTIVSRPHKNIEGKTVKEKVITKPGKIILKAIDSISRDNIKSEAKKHIEPGTQLMTDESNLYLHSLKGYPRQSVNHSQKEWVRGNCHTNNVENVWSIMKRGIYGIYHQISTKHLQAYCDEFSYRYNSRSTQDGNRFENALTHLEGRLKYLTLIKKEDGKISQDKKISAYKATQKKGN